MTFDQFAIIAILCAMLGCFALERPRIELTALVGVAAAYLLGLLPPAAVFSGFSHPAFVTVLEILLIIQAVGRSAVIERAADYIHRTGAGEMRITLLLCGLAAFVSIFMNNIGAFSIVLPIALSVARSSGIDPRKLIMPISFAALLGGLGSVIGTPANLIVSNALADATGEGFAFFDFAYVGIPVALAGLAVIAFWSGPRLARNQTTGKQSAIDRQVVTEVAVTASSRLAGRRSADVEAENAIEIYAVIRQDRHVFGRKGSAVLEAGDVCLVRMASSRLESMLDAGQLSWRGGLGPGEMAEVVVTPGSLLVGAIPRTIAIFERAKISITAIATNTGRIEGRLDDIRLSIGDVLYVEGERSAIFEAVQEAEALLVTPTKRSVGSSSNMPILFFAGGIALAAFGLASPAVAFGATVLALGLAGHLNLRTALGELDWPILIMLAMMIPLGGAVQTTGTADLVAASILAMVPGTGTFSLVLAMLAIAAAITPFVNNASTAIILSPIALELAARSGSSGEALLMAVAIGASLDFMTPFGHHNNTLAMSLGGYRFTEFIRAGLPVTLIGFFLSAALIALFWL